MAPTIDPNKKAQIAAKYWAAQNSESRPSGENPPPKRPNRPPPMPPVHRVLTNPPHQPFNTAANYELHLNPEAGPSSSPTNQHKQQEENNNPLFNLANIFGPGGTSGTDGPETSHNLGADNRPKTMYMPKNGSNPYRQPPLPNPLSNTFDALGALDDEEENDENYLNTAPELPYEHTETTNPPNEHDIASLLNANIVQENQRLAQENNTLKQELRGLKTLVQNLSQQVTNLTNQINTSKAQPTYQPTYTPANPYNHTYNTPPLTPNTPNSTVSEEQVQQEILYGVRQGASDAVGNFINRFLLGNNAFGFGSQLNAMGGIYNPLPPKWQPAYPTNNPAFYPPPKDIPPSRPLQPAPKIAVPQPQPKRKKTSILNADYKNYVNSQIAQFKNPNGQLEDTMYELYNNLGLEQQEQKFKLAMHNLGTWGLNLNSENYEEFIQQTYNQRETAIREILSIEESEELTDKHKIAFIMLTGNVRDV